MRQPLQLQRLGGGPFEAGVLTTPCFPPPPALNTADERLERGGHEDDEEAEGENEDQAEQGEGDVGCAADFLFLFSLVS